MEPTMLFKQLFSWLGISWQAHKRTGLMRLSRIDDATHRSAQAPGAPGSIIEWFLAVSKGAFDQAEDESDGTL